MTHYSSLTCLSAVVCLFIGCSDDSDPRSDADNPRGDASAGDASADDASADGSPDGSQVPDAGLLCTARLAFVAPSDEQGQIYVSNADGSGAIDRTQNLDYEHFAPTWSPDGSRIAFRREPPVEPTPPEWWPAHIWTMNADGTDAVQVTSGPDRDSQAGWSPDGTQFAFIRGDQDETRRLFVVDAAGGEPRDLAVPAPLQPAWSPDGMKLVFHSDSDRQIYTVNSDGTDLTNLTNDTVFHSDPIWSPDGERILFLRFSGASPDAPADIWTIGADGSSPRNLSETPENDESGAVYSPDGAKIFYRRYTELPSDTEPTGETELHSMNADGTGVQQITFFDEGHSFGVAVSPDSACIAWTHSAVVYVANADGTASLPVTPTYWFSHAPDWQPSPSGT